MITAHTDVVGSLLRPAELLRAREAREAGRMTAAAFKKIEDEAVDEAVRLQEAAGLEIVSDGEMRRLSFQSQMTEAVEGFGGWDLDAFLWGEWHGVEGAETWRTERPADLGVTGKLTRRRHLSSEEFVYLRGRTGRIPKVTLPSPGLFANFWSADISRHAYPTLDGVLADVVRILKEEVEELARLGASYIQIDAPHYPLLLDPATRAFYESRGWTLGEWLERGIEFDNAVIDGVPGVTFGFHLCRGNQNNRWLVEGGYEAIAEPIFRGIRAERLLLEYDDARSGSFAPLAQVGDDRMVVLGLVSTKRPALEEPELLARRIDEAARYIDKERLALSTQCGFSTSIIGNAPSLEAEKAKLRLVAEVARRVWG
ncbi:MAG: cobalamin-independent methionine synthase II family protein [Alphaproteobacteria bacterium]|nr:cobalamin-independent methionine synthase II family protein [Alphaproteobacteria bacterium]